MNKYFIFALLTIFSTSQLLGQTAAELEAEFAERALEFKDHPLYLYMTPLGSYGLKHLLGIVRIRCRNEVNKNSEECKEYQIAAANKAQGYGFTGIKPEHFRSPRLFILRDEMFEYYKRMQNHIGKVAKTLPRKERKPYGILKRERANLIRALKTQIRDGVITIDLPVSELYLSITKKAQITYRNRKKPLPGEMTELFQDL